MENNKLIRKIQMACPMCDKVHEIEERTRISCTIIKGKKVEYEEIYYFCCNSGQEENEFVNGKMQNVNLMNARNSYEKSFHLA